MVERLLRAGLPMGTKAFPMVLLTVRGRKRSLNLIADALWLGEDARAEIAALEAGAFASNDLREGMAAFAEKRTPDFHGN